MPTEKHRYTAFSATSRLPPPAEGSAEVAARVAAARARQGARYGRVAGDRPARTKAPGTNAPGTNAPGTNAPGTNAPRTNAEADGRLLEAVAAPDAEGRRLLTERPSA